MPTGQISKKLSGGEINALLRGVATLAVIVIHFLANIPHVFQVTSPGWVDALVIDQLSRFCVPLFVMLSGYGFWQKYQYTEGNWWLFWWRQVQKLLPLYILASLIFYVIFLVVPHWRDPAIPQSFIIQLLLGKADYQLYFVPAIFQLYLLFPLLRKVVRKFPWVSLLIALGFQLWLYKMYNSAVPYSFIAKHLSTDQQQYIWFFTWIFYFILGMHLPRVLEWLFEKKRRIVAIGLGVGTSFLVVVARGYDELLHGVDPIIALRSTHADVLFYAALTGVFLFAVAHASRLKTHGWLNILLKPLLWVGKYSYPIYLFHAMVLRMLFSTGL